MKAEVARWRSAYGPFYDKYEDDGRGSAFNFGLHLRAKTAKLAEPKPEKREKAWKCKCERRRRRCRSCKAIAVFAALRDMHS